jgi:hypothetical protein
LGREAGAADTEIAGAAEERPGEVAGVDFRRQIESDSGIRADLEGIDGPLSTGVVGVGSSIR